MFDTMINAASVAAGNLRLTMPIHRIADGRPVDKQAQKELHTLPDHLLHDIGLNRGR